MPRRTKTKNKPKNRYKTVPDRIWVAAKDHIDRVWKGMLPDADSIIIVRPEYMTDAEWNELNEEIDKLVESKGYEVVKH